ncbi:MAG: QueT transporter family protein [Ruminococcaceae bacterium]|nr:QueT transporter family protein [Oscillospiraceae bacterium]
MKNKKVLKTVQAAVIAAIYAVLTSLLWEFSSLAIQVRASEALSVLPCFTPSAVPGLFVGCLISNIIRGNFIDAIFGSLTTLVASVLGKLIYKKTKGKKAVYLMLVPSVVLNAIAIPFILYYGYGMSSFAGFEGVWTVLGIYSVSVFAGQMISCYGLGIPLYHMLCKIDERTNIISLK